MTQDILLEKIKKLIEEKKKQNKAFLSVSRCDITRIDGVNNETLQDSLDSLLETNRLGMYNAINDSYYYLNDMGYHNN